jgi:hypothetical protein
MNKKLGIGIAAAVIAAGLVYLYRRRARTEQESIEPARTRHRTDVFAKAKAAQSPVTNETPAM